jgi:hypothetical protein
LLQVKQKVVALDGLFLIGLRPSLFDAGQNIRHDLRPRLRALRAAVVEALGDVVYEPFSSS